MAVLDGRLYAVGGHNGTERLNSVERYDPATDTWEAVAPMGTVRNALGVVVLDGAALTVSITANVWLWGSR